MPRESRVDRGRRFLLERRLVVERVDGTGLVVASCRGDSGELRHLGFDPLRNEWRCTCPASAQFRRECAHLVALKHVTVVGGNGTGK